MAKAVDTRKFNGGEEVEYMHDGETFTGVVDGVRYNEDEDGNRYNFRYIVHHTTETDEEFEARYVAAEESGDELPVRNVEELEFTSSQLNAL